MAQIIPNIFDWNQSADTPVQLGKDTHTGYPETTNASDNNTRSWNQHAEIGCNYLSGYTLPRFTLIRGKLFPDRYLLPMAVKRFQ